uniref:Protein SDA1 n=1 Tax=Meloidogyne floridensis TaxID=298350 RepID=A0A915P761_9BILA
MNSSCPEDDWGCVPDDELFFNSGPTQPFQTLMKKFIEEVTKRGESYKEELRDDYEESNDSEEEEEEMPQSFNFQTKDVADDFLPLRVGNKLAEENSLVIQEKKSTGILRKNNSLDSPINPKRVTFEIERFVASSIADHDEKLTAQQRLIQKLGGKPARNPSINYKTLKKKREELKEKKKEDFLNFEENTKVRGIKRKKGNNKNIKGKKNNKRIMKGKIKNQKRAKH